jgi:hypothetical protein
MDTSVTALKALYQYGDVPHVKDDRARRGRGLLVAGQGREIRQLRLACDVLFVLFHDNPSAGGRGSIPVRV